MGAHFTAVERRGENATILLYATRNNTATQKAEVFVVSMNATAVAVLPTIAQLPYTETDLYHEGSLIGNLEGDTYTTSLSPGLSYKGWSPSVFLGTSFPVVSGFST